MATNKQLSTQQKDELRQATTFVHKLQGKGKAGDFWELYCVCEKTAQLLIKYDKNLRKTSDSPINKNDLKKAIKNYSINIDENIFDKIFVSSGKEIAGNRTCRQLRNKYVHSKKSIKEIETRFDELKGYMDKWIDLFK